MVVNHERKNSKKVIENRWPTIIFRKKVEEKRNRKMRFLITCSGSLKFIEIDLEKTNFFFFKSSIKYLKLTLQNIHLITRSLTYAFLETDSVFPCFLISSNDLNFLLFLQIGVMIHTFGKLPHSCESIKATIPVNIYCIGILSKQKKYL